MMIGMPNAGPNPTPAMPPRPQGAGLAGALNPQLIAKLQTFLAGAGFGRLVEDIKKLKNTFSPSGAQTTGHHGQNQAAGQSPQARVPTPAPPAPGAPTNPGMTPPISLPMLMQLIARARAQQGTGVG